MGNELQYYNAAKSALATCARVDEVKDVKDKAEAIRLYARQQSDSELERYAAMIKARAMRRLGELSADLDVHEQAKGGRLPTSGMPTKTSVLKDAGISTSTAHRCEVIAAIPEVEFEAQLEKGATVTEMLRSQNVHVSNNSGENEWYTPPNIIEAARLAMGSIDLDPASSEIANRTVRAGKFYTAADDGLAQPWHGNVWLNPPYSRPLIDQYAARLAASFRDKQINQACALVNNATETNWFLEMGLYASALCLLARRVKFIDVHGNATGAPLQGQVIIYLGNAVERFFNRFCGLGSVWVKHSQPR